MTAVLLVGDPDTPLAAQLATLPTRAPLRVAAFAGFHALPVDTSFALLSASLAAPDEVLLRILDDPALGVAALVGPVADGAADVATQGALVQSAATAAHPVPDADSMSLGAVFVSASVAAAAKGVLQATHAASDAALDPVDLAIAALVRSPEIASVTAVRAEPFPARRDGGPLPAVTADLAARSAARPGDGFYSTFVLRKVSARVTPWCVRHRVPANAVTLVSFLVGLAAAGSFALGSYPWLVAGAVLLQVCLVLDCVDGEIARATRTRSAFGAWLDGATDRIKEYAALAGLALAGHDLWLLAGVGMVVQTVRHVQDFAFDKGMLAAWRASLRDQRPLSDTSPWVRPAGSGRGPEPLTGSPVMWAKRVVRMPIAERWLVLTICALINRPWLALTLYAALAALAWLYTLPGAIARTRRPGPSSDSVRRRLDAFVDWGPLDPGRAFDGIAGWAFPVLATALEGAAVLVATHGYAPAWDAAAFGWFAAVAWHRYDVVYRTGDVPRLVNLLGLGWFLRIAAVETGAAADVLPWVLVIGICWMVLVYVPESIYAGIRTARA